MSNKYLKTFVAVLMSGVGLTALAARPMIFQIDNKTSFFGKYDNSQRLSIAYWCAGPNQAVDPIKTIGPGMNTMMVCGQSNNNFYAQISYVILTGTNTITCTFGASSYPSTNHISGGPVSQNGYPPSSPLCQLESVDDTTGTITFKILPPDQNKLPKN